MINRTNAGNFDNFATFFRKMAIHLINEIDTERRTSATQIQIDYIDYSEKDISKQQNDETVGKLLLLLTDLLTDYFKLQLIFIEKFIQFLLWTVQPRL